MIRLLAYKPSFDIGSVKISQQEFGAVFSARIGRRELCSAILTFTPLADDELLVSRDFYEAQGSLDGLKLDRNEHSKRRHRYVGDGWDSYQRQEREEKEIQDKFRPLCEPLENLQKDCRESVARLVSERIKKEKCVFPLRSNLVGDVSFYAFCQESVWSSKYPLSNNDWLIASSLQLAQIDNELGLVKRQGTLRKTISVEVRNSVWRRDEGKCLRCGSTARLEFDHIIPLSLGGSDTIRNIELLCEACNRSKGARL